MLKWKKKILQIFRKLRTKEKRIHRHLYWAMLIQVVIRLILYFDQFLSRSGGVIAEQRSLSGVTVEVNEGHDGGNGTFEGRAAAIGIDNTVTMI